MLRRSRYCHNVFKTWAAAFTTFRDDLGESEVMLMNVGGTSSGSICRDLSCKPVIKRPSLQGPEGTGATAGKHDRGIRCTWELGRFRAGPGG